MLRRAYLFLLISLLGTALALPACWPKRTPDISAEVPQATVQPVINPPDSDEFLHDLLEEAAEHAQAGRALMETGDVDEGRNELEQAFILLGRALEAGTEDEQLQVNLDKLLMDVCTDMLRVNVVVGGDGPSLGDELPLDFVYNPDVESWVLYFMTNGRRSMNRWLERSARYGNDIERVLKEEGVPNQLAALPIIESGYSPFAVSPAGAAGLWQFIRSTGKNYGLIITDWVDERRNPEKATRAACQYLKFLHARYDSWPLALAAYNCGEGCIDRAIAAKGTPDFWKLDLNWETSAYVPKFYAAMLIMSNPGYYGFEAKYEEPMESFPVKLKGVVDLEQMCKLSGINYEHVKILNPEVLSKFSPPNIVPYTIRLPLDSEESFKSTFWSQPDEKKYLSNQKVADLLRSGPPVGGRSSSRGKVVYHTVKKGESLWTIARKYNVSVNDIKKWNRSARGRYLQPGMRLKIRVRR